MLILEEHLKEMKRRGACHLVISMQFDGEARAAGPDVLYFNNDEDYKEWCKLQPVIYDDCSEVSILVLHRL